MTDANATHDAADDTPDGSDETPPVSVPVPAEYAADEELRTAYLRGCAAMAQLFGHAASMREQVVAVALEGDAPTAVGPGGGAAVDDEDEETCRICGQPLLASMGADETAHSPAGTVCPDCDL
jgi:hypothetical protein